MVKMVDPTALLTQSQSKAFPQIGIIASAADPSGKGRVQVKLPLLANSDGGNAAGWARVCRPFGLQTGAPQVGAAVLVVFEGGELDRPIVVGRVD
jgi:uncharacterized protein involved in type VI secretion and phage assembly